MPGAKRKTNQELNEAYAFITSTDFQATVESLRDGLVRNGFERQEAKDLIHSVEGPEGDDLFTISSAITFTATEMPEPETIPAALQNKVEIAPEAGTITLKGRFTPNQAKTLESAFKTPAEKDTIRQALSRMHTPRVPNVKTPSDFDFHTE